MHNLIDLSIRCHALAKSKGFWPETGRNVGECFLLMVSELSEAVEAHRHEKYCLVNTVATAIPRTHDEVFHSWFKANVKDTIQDEMADAVIRMMDFCGRHDIDMDKLWSDKKEEWGQDKLDSFLSIGNFGALLLQPVRFVCLADFYYGKNGMAITYGVFSSLMDALILIEHITSAYLGSDLWWHVDAKLAYNSGRGHLHGKAY